jgi:hypothetical protein
MGSSRSRVWAFIAFGLLVAGAGWIAVEAIASGSSEISSCVTDSTGAVRIVRDPTGYTSPSPTCTEGEHPLAWTKSTSPASQSATQLVNVQKTKRPTAVKPDNWRTLTSERIDFGQFVKQGQLSVSGPTVTVDLIFRGVATEKNPTAKPGKAAIILVRAVVNGHPLAHPLVAEPLIAAHAGGFRGTDTFSGSVAVPMTWDHPASIRIQARGVGPFNRRRVAVTGQLQVETTGLALCPGPINASGGCPF